MVQSIRAASSAASLIVACLWLPVAAVIADEAGTAPPAPKENFLSSLKQAFKSDFDHEVVRGHFEVGTPPDIHRYYCLVDAKTGKREPNGVSGEPEKRKDGMTGLKPGAAVTLYDCASAESQGNLVTAGYLLSGKAAVSAVGPGVAPESSAERSQPSAAKVDVAGVRLGMSVAEVRTQLKAKMLLNVYESSQTLGSGNARYVNVIAAWTRDSNSADDAAATGESFEVMFTPVPGRERVMAVIHSMNYSASEGPKESDVQGALAKKYGASVATSNSNIWRVQADGTVQADDACHRRKLYGGMGRILPLPARGNGALATTPEEFRYQVEHCGVAVITEDHAATSTAGEPYLTAISVSAYSPVIAFEGATSAAQLMQSPEPRNSTGRATVRRSPSL